MTYASIMVHVEPDPKAAPRLKLAADIANQFQARLIGACAEIFEPSAFGSEYANVDGELLVAEAKVIETDLKLAEERFQNVARPVTAGSQWRCGVALPAEAMPAEARAADLIIAGPRYKSPYGFHNRPDPGDLVMRAGRPVLVAPLELERLDASSIVIAWKDTREARRATSDAMPFLKRARQVLVVGICAEAEAADVASSLEDVAEYLACHGVKASTAVRAPGKATVAEALLEMADMQDAGLLVTGGYGHARMSEWIFGGVTQELLGGCHKAVLLSH